MRAGLVGSWRAHERIPPEGPVMQVTRGLLAGGIFFAIGASATFIASDYRMGTIVRMGPGFFPVAIGCVIALIGALIIVQELLTGNKTEPVELVHLRPLVVITRSEEHTSELQSLMRISYAVFCLKKTTNNK